MGTNFWYVPCYTTTDSREDWKLLTPSQTYFKNIFQKIKSLVFDFGYWYWSWKRKKVEDDEIDESSHDTDITLDIFLPDRKII